MIDDFGYDMEEWVNMDFNPRIMGDVNGDGNADIVAMSMDKTYISFSNGRDKFTTKLNRHLRFWTHWECITISQTIMSTTFKFRIQ